MSKWEVVGGQDKGGILVREGQALGSPATKERLSTGATIEELELVGERLHYKLIEGTGPAEGWVSLRISGKELVVPKEEEEEAGGPAETGGAVEVDEDLKAQVEKDFAEKKKQDVFLNYVMKYKVLGFPLESPKLRVLCFHNAGSAESNYTSPGTPFIVWIKETKAVEVCAIDFPGRDKLRDKPKITDTQKLAADLLAVLYEKISDGVPYVVWAHSVGTWVSFELLMLARKIGLPMPKAAFMMAFPAPHMSVKQRPWRKNKRLNDAQMREELMNWDQGHFKGPGKVVYDEPGWKDTWEPMMRADFCLFDEYKFTHSGAPKFDFPIHAWHMEGEYFNKAEMIQLWGDWTTAKFDFGTMKDMGHLTCFYNPAYKKTYFTKIVEGIKEYVP